MGSISEYNCYIVVWSDCQHGQRLFPYQQVFGWLRWYKDSALGCSFNHCCHSGHGEHPQCTYMYQCSITVTSGIAITRMYGGLQMRWRRQLWAILEPPPNSSILSHMHFCSTRLFLYKIAHADAIYTCIYMYVVSANFWLCSLSVVLSIKCEHDCIWKHSCIIMETDKP